MTYFITEIIVLKSLTSIWNTGCRDVSSNGRPWHGSSHYPQVSAYGPKTAPERLEPQQTHATSDPGLSIWTCKAFSFLVAFPSNALLNPNPPPDDCQRRQTRMQIQNAGYHGHISLIGAALPCYLCLDSFGKVSDELTPLVFEWITSDLTDRDPFRPRTTTFVRPSIDTTLSCIARLLPHTITHSSITFPKPLLARHIILKILNLQIWNFRKTSAENSARRMI